MADPLEDLSSIFDIGSQLFGTSRKERTSGTSTRTGTRTEQLELDRVAINKIIQDVLGGTGGLADIFAGEQSAGIFGSSVAAQSAGNFVANLVGELAKLQAKKVTTEEAEETFESTTKKKDGGLLGAIKKLF